MKFYEKIKDLLYDSIDYVIMITIILVVVAVIGWRLDVLFAKDANDIHDPGKVVVDTTTKPSNNSKDDVHNEDEPIEEDPTEAETPSNEPTVVTPPVATGEKIKVNIPAGSLPGKIGSILEENGLISSSRDFIQKAVELKLDTKLKSGTFNIEKGSTHEEILKIITK